MLVLLLVSANTEVYERVGIDQQTIKERESLSCFRLGFLGRHTFTELHVESTCIGILYSNRIVHLSPTHTSREAS